MNRRQTHSPGRSKFDSGAKRRLTAKLTAKLPDFCGRLRTTMECAS
jgi:hypothetical protein